MTQFLVVNSNDEVIGLKEKVDLNENDIIRVAVLWIVNSKGEILLSQRVLTKQHDLGKWGATVAGRLEKDETYTSNIIKEAQEEIGLTINEKDLIIGTRTYIEASHKFFCLTFVSKIDLPLSAFIKQDNEVAQLRWVPLHELETWFAQKPEDFVVFFRKGLNIFLASVNNLVL